MTGPAVLSDDSELAKWHDIAANAIRVPRGDARYARAQQALAAARNAIRSWVNTREVANEQTAQNESDDAQTDRLGPVGGIVAGAQQLARGAAFGLDDEAAGLIGAMGAGFRGQTLGEGYRQGRDDQREFNRVANEDYPGPAFLGNAVGSLATGAVGGAALLPAKLAARVGAGYRVGAPILDRIVSAGILGGVGAGEGVVRGAAGADEPGTTVADKINAGAQGGIWGALAGMAGGAVTQGLNATHNVASDAMRWVRARRELAEENLLRTRNRPMIPREAPTSAPTPAVLAPRRVFQEYNFRTADNAEGGVLPLPMRPQIMDRPTAPAITTRPAVAVPQEVVAQTPMPSALPPENVPPILRTVRGRHGNLDGAAVSTEVPAATRAFAQLAARSPEEVRQVLSGLSPAEVEAVRQEAMNAVRYGWLSKPKRDMFTTLLGPLQ